MICVSTSICVSCAFFLVLFFCFFVWSYSVLFAFILFFFYYLFIFRCLFSNEREKRKNVDLGGQGVGKGLGGVGGKETIIRLYPIKIYLQLKEKEKGCYLHKDISLSFESPCISLDPFCFPSLPDSQLQAQHLTHTPTSVEETLNK